MDRHICYNPKQEAFELAIGTSSDFALPQPQLKQNTGFVRGRLVKLKTNSPVCFADISSSDKTFFAKSILRENFCFLQLYFQLLSKSGNSVIKTRQLFLILPKIQFWFHLLLLRFIKIFCNKTPIQFGLVLKKALEKSGLTMVLNFMNLMILCKGTCLLPHQYIGQFRDYQPVWNLCS